MNLQDVAGLETIDRLTTHPLLADLEAIVGRDYVLRDASLLAPYATSPNYFPPTKPSLVVRPADEREVLELLTLASATRTPVLVRGRGLATGGFLTSTARSIMLDTTRMDRVLDVDETNYLVTAECGIAITSLLEAVEAKGLFFSGVSSPLANGVSLGGLLSGVVGGGGPAREGPHGFNGRQLLALSVALANGQILRTGVGGVNVHRRVEQMRGGGGPDLTGLFIGDGGWFGVKLTATLQLFPERPLTAAGAWDFPNFESFYRAFNDLARLDPLPFGILTGTEVNGAVQLEYLVETQSPVLREAFQQEIDQICLRAGGVEVPPPPGGFDYSSRGNWIVAYCSRSEVPAVREALRDYVATALRAHGLDKRGVTSDLAYRPQQRSAVYIAARLGWNVADLPDGAPEIATLSDIVSGGHKLAVSLGCSLSSHHGVISGLIASAWSPEFGDTMTSLKRVFDPHAILNPGLWS